jgi:hypothetical protein
MSAAQATTPTQPMPAPDAGTRVDLTFLHHALEIKPGSKENFVQSLPFCFRDVTAGAENEFQAVVLGNRADVDLPITIESANFFKNMVRRAEAGDTSRKTVTALERYLERKNHVWENSWVRFPEKYLNNYAREVFNSDLLADKASPAAGLRSDAGQFRFIRAGESMIRFLFTQLLVQYAEQKLGLKESGQEVRVFFSASPPVMQHRLNECLSDAFYRFLFMSPCLSGWNRGEEKHAYMTLCHEVLSRSQINGIAKLRQAGIIQSNLVILPHELDDTHLRMLWRRWKKKAANRILGRPVTPFGPVWLDRLIRRVFGLKGDFVPDFRLVDYLVSLLSTDQSSGLDGSPGNSARLGQDLAQMGVFDTRMPLYQLIRLREFARMGYTGFEHRYYSIFEHVLTDMGNAADMQTLITALAYQYVLNGEVTHAMIPDTPDVESERRQLFFCAALNLPFCYVKTDTWNRFLKWICGPGSGNRFSRISSIPFSRRQTWTSFSSR